MSNFFKGFPKENNPFTLKTHLKHADMHTRSYFCQRKLKLNPRRARRLRARAPAGGVAVWGAGDRAPGPPDPCPASTPPTQTPAPAPHSFSTTETASRRGDHLM